MGDARTDIPIRRMAFDFGADTDLVFFRRDPVLSYGSHAYWLTMPYLEPYLMRSIRAAMDSVRDAALRERMARFCSQEGQHFRQHAELNEFLRASHPEFASLRALEAALDAEYRAFTRERDRAFNLAYAEAFESMTLAMSCVQMEMGVHEQMTPPIRELFLWHITEEMEHRCVAFDAYGALGRGYVYRLRTGRWARRHYLGWVGRFHRALLVADAVRVAALQTPQMVAERRAFEQAFARRLRPRLWATGMPWYHPARVRMPADFEAARTHVSDLAVEIA